MKAITVEPHKPGDQPDVIVECTGAGEVIADAIQAIAPGGVVCLTGGGSGGRAIGLTTADVASNVVLRNNVVVGSVNANKRHWYKAAQAPARADRACRLSGDAAGSA